MAPTNNESERVLRRFVIHRKIRMSWGSYKGMKVVENILTCMITWRKRGLNTDTVHTWGKLNDHTKNNLV